MQFFFYVFYKTNVQTYLYFFTHIGFCATLSIVLVLLISMHCHIFLLFFYSSLLIFIYLCTYIFLSSMKFPSVDVSATLPSSSLLLECLSSLLYSSSSSPLVGSRKMCSFPVSVSSRHEQWGQRDNGTTAKRRLKKVSSAAAAVAKGLLSCS